MQTPASVLGHPVHRMLIALALGLWVFSLLCDLLYLSGAEAGLWSALALYAMVGGFAAAVPGFADSVSPAGRREKTLALTPMNVIVAVVALYAVNLWLRFSDPANLAIAIVLSVVGVGMLAVSSWLGDELAAPGAAGDRRWR